MNKLMKPSELQELTELGTKEFEKVTIEGPLFKEIISNIESAALEGYSEWEQGVVKSDDVKALKVIRKYLLSAGYSCQFETEDVNGFFGIYKKQTFVVDWREEDE